MKNNTLTNLNHFFWNNINYYFSCFKKRKEDEDEDDTNDLLAVQTIIMYNE